MLSRNMPILVLMGLLLSLQNYCAQYNSLTDYKVYRDQHQPLGCQVMDSVLFEKTLQELLLLDTTQFNQNLDAYYRDLAQAYSSKWIYSNKTEDLSNAIIQLKRIKQYDWSDLWNLAIHSIKLNECEQGLNYLNRYLSETPKEFWVPQMDIWLLQNACMKLASNDYKIYRQTQLNLSCAPQDSATVIQKLMQLQLLDTTYFIVNMDSYYQDLGWAYYRTYMIVKDPILLQRSNVSYFKQAVLSSSDHLNIASNYYLLGNCEKGTFHVKEYRKKTPWTIERKQRVQIKRLKQPCC